MNGRILKDYQPNNESEFDALYSAWLATRGAVALRDLSINELDEARGCARAILAQPVHAADPMLNLFETRLGEALNLKSNMERWTTEAHKLGVEAGENAGSWAADGNTTESHARKVLQLIQDGDPEADDYLPRRPNLSGEYADDPTPLSVAREVIGADEVEDWIVEAIADAWEDGVRYSFIPRCEKELTSVLPEEPEEEDDIRFPEPGDGLRRAAKLLDVVAHDLNANCHIEALLEEVPDLDLIDTELERAAKVLRREADREDEGPNRRPLVGQRIVVHAWFTDVEVDRGVVLGYKAGLVDRGSPESGPGPLEEEELVVYFSDNKLRTETVTMDRWEEELLASPREVRLPEPGEEVLVIPRGETVDSYRCWRAQFIRMVADGRFLVRSKAGGTTAQTQAVERIARLVEYNDIFARTERGDQS